MTQVSVIIANYNGAKYLPALLMDLINQSVDDFTTIIVDDASGDDSLRIIREIVGDHPRFQVLESEVNRGFIGSCYAGLNQASGDYLCFLNNDTRLDRLFIEKNRKIFEEDPSIGVLSSLIVDKEGNNWFSGGRIVMGIPRILTDDFRGIREVDWIAATAVFYRRRVLEEVGFWRKEYRMYHEDVEFSMRVRRNTEYRLCIFSNPLVRHLEPGTSQSARRHFYYHFHNLILLQKEYFPWHIFLTLLLYIPANLIRVIFGSQSWEEKKGYVSGCLSGAFSGLLVKARSSREQ